MRDAASDGLPPTVEQMDGGGAVSLYEKSLTLIHPFWGEDQRFTLLVDNWSNYAQFVKDKLKIIIVDDHGTPSVKSLITPDVINQLKGINLTVYEIEDDLKYNTPGALNLGIMVADTEWVLIMDSDCTFLPEAMYSVMEYKPMDDCLYLFDRLRVTKHEHLLKNERYLTCTMLMRKQIFLELNGFDEDYTGERSKGYGFFDVDFHRKLIASKYNTGIVQDNIIVTEWMSDVCGEKVSRTDDEMKINKRLCAEKTIAGTLPHNNEMLRFAWKKVYSK